jgi:gamma-glutamylcyclotransferase (GGCT)/AIG2-like uncharacterized protein YtfP
VHRIFVYGTLKRGLLNHELIASSRFLGPAATTERFRMIADSFPVLFNYPTALTSDALRRMPFWQSRHTSRRSRERAPC